jgi:hypothetical protein
MATTYYVDLYNGVDHAHANSGLSWATAYKTILGLTSKVTTITGGDTIRVSKTEDPKNTGINATWTGVYSVGGGMEAAKNITGSSNTTPINISATTHGYSNGDVVHVQAHTINLSANGYWIITGVTTNGMQLVDSIGIGTGGASGTITKINPKVILLDEPLTKNIHTCNYLSATINNWTPGTNVTSANLSTTVWKEGYSSVYVVNGAAVGANQILVKSALPVSLDLSAYFGISFYMMVASTSTVLTGGDLLIKLYSDTGCTNEVESLSVPGYIALQNVIFQPVVINKGSALSSTVQGIAVYATVALASKAIIFDNFIAIKGENDVGYLNHRSIVSKNGAALINSGNTEGFYPIKAINERIVVIDGGNTYANAGRGYWGTTENTTLFTRNPIRVDYTNQYGNIFSNKNGTTSAFLNIIFGYNTGTTTIDGETWVEGGSILAFSQSYIAYSGHLGIVRKGNALEALTYVSFDEISSIGGYSFQFNNGVAYFKNVWNYNNNSGAFVAGKIDGNSSVNPINVDNIWNCNNQNGSGIDWWSTANVKVQQLKHVDNCNNNGVNGIWINGATTPVTVKQMDRNQTAILPQGGYTKFYILSGITNNAIAFGSFWSPMVIDGTHEATLYNNTLIRGLLTVSVGFLYTNNNKVIIKNFKSYQTYSMDNVKYLTNTLYNDTTYRDVDTITQDTGTTYSGNNSWKLMIAYNYNLLPGLWSGYTNESAYPLILTIGKVYVAANLPVTVSAYMKNSSATAIGGKLYMAPYQLSGQTDELQAYSTSTDWTKITLPTFTPLEAGVIEIEARAWYISSLTQSVWVDALEVIQ